MLVDNRGDGVARVMLDYVTPRFRDFSPGEFVWRRSGLLRESGFRRVVTPPDMVAPYYERVGFQREGDVFTLEGCCDRLGAPRPSGREWLGPRRRRSHVRAADAVGQRVQRCTAAHAPPGRRRH